jgi:hypothetical protein
MKPKILFVVILFSFCINSISQNRTMIAVQAEAVLASELGLREYLNDAQFNTVRNIANTIVNTFTSSKSQFQGAGKYQRIVNLNGNNCKRANLLAQLIEQTEDGFHVDLYIFGHGGPEKLMLFGDSLTGGSNGNIRSMLAEARRLKGSSTFSFKLRLVYMGDCFASSLNDDWLAIGAKTSIGSEHLDYMPEPMAFSFVHNFVNEQRSVAAAANTAFNDAKAFWTATATLSQLVGANIGYLNTNDPKCDAWGTNTTKIQDCKSTTRIDQSKLVIAGNSKLIFADQHQFAVNQSKTFSIIANKAYNFVSLYVTAGETYTFSTSSSDTWTNCNGCPFVEKTCNAGGYAKGPTDFPRRGNLNMMSMVGEHFRKFNDAATYNNVAFLIGNSKTYSPNSNGFINIMANDILTGYADNSGSISVTVTRTQ